jgi:hypothetical protein
MSRITKTVLRNAAERIADGRQWCMCWAVSDELGLGFDDAGKAALPKIPPEFERIVRKHGVVTGGNAAMDPLGEGYGDQGFGTDEERRAVRVLFLLFLAESL